MKGRKMSKKVAYTALTAVLMLASVGATAGLMSHGEVRADEAKETASNLTTNSLATNLVDETVYVFLGTDGAVKKTISSDWTKNDLGADVYSKTEGKVNTPIEMKISYFLDGKEVKADEIRGRSGKVKIRYDYTNKDIVSGAYVPYAVISGAVLSNEHFSNVTVKNGRLVNDGARMTVVGWALPGMKEDLGVSLDIPDFVEIEADAKDFKMEMTATIATSKIFAEIDTSALNSIDSLSSQLNTLASSMEQLMAGSTQLRDGLTTLNNKTGILADGVAQLKAGSLKLADGSQSLSDGIYNALNGAKQLDVGVDKTIAGVSSLVENLNKLDANSATITTKLQTAIDTILAEFKKNPLLADVTVETFETKVKAAIEKLIALGDNDNASALKTAAEKYGPQLQLYQGILVYVGNVSAIVKGAAATDLSELKVGSTGLVNGLAEIYAGSQELAAGMVSLDAGVSNLNSNVPALTDGVSKLADGSNRLTDGLSLFNSEGIQKLISLYNGDVKALVSRIQNMVNLAKNSKTKVKYIYRTEEI
ncbi:hypothetical protein IJH19_00695 [Candidatus Saccharibacteria bacterium]|nr:hypothetical protein [Candidatus Saccharibacteria bacterium]